MLLKKNDCDMTAWVSLSLNKKLSCELQKKFAKNVDNQKIDQFELAELICVLQVHMIE